MTTYEILIESGKKEIQEQMVINCFKEGATKEFTAKVAELSLEEVTRIYHQLSLKK